MNPESSRINGDLPDGISVIVPVYQAMDTLDELVRGLEVEIPKINPNFEVILVDDGSLDSSWEVILKLAKELPFVHGIQLMRNYGQHNATLCGVRNARYAITLTMDDDLQHGPSEVGKLFAELKSGYDVVYGAPRRQTQGYLRNLVTRHTKRFLAWVMGVPSIRNISAFRVFRTDLRKAFETFSGPNLILDVLLSWGTGRFSSVYVDESPRLTGKSNYNFFMLVQQALLILVGFSTVPLRFASYLGFLMTLFGLGVFIYVLVLYFAEGSLPGFPFLASIISLFGGVQLFTLGIFGEYLARVFNRSMDKPPYVINKTSGQESC